MMIIVALVVGYLLLSLLATIVLISACVVGKRYDSLFNRSDDLEQQKSLVSVRDTGNAEINTGTNAETNAEARVANDPLNQFMPQLTRQVTE